MNDRPIFWFVCDAPKHAETPLGGIVSAHNDPHPARHAAHQQLAARVLGDRFEPTPPPEARGGFGIVAAWWVKKRRGWKWAHRVMIADGLVTLSCPTCGRRVQVPVVDLEVRMVGGRTHLQPMRNGLPVGEPIPPNTPVSVGRLDRRAH